MAIRLALLSGIIPILAAAGAYLIALSQGYEAQCVPLVQGCTSISRAARYGEAIFWFRGLMMPLSAVLVFFWLAQVRWLNHWIDPHNTYRSLLVLGILSALALVIYVNFLGTDGEVYQFMRRFGVTFYFGFGALAQLLVVNATYPQRRRLAPESQKWVTWQLACVSAQWVLGLISLSSDFLPREQKAIVENIIEWNFALAMMLFHLLNVGIWRSNRVPSAAE